MEATNSTRIIISDLHLGKNDDFDIFQAPEKDDVFEQFLEHCAKLEGPVELIINGDFVDFLQLRPWDIYITEKKISVQQQALTKIKEIVQGNKRIFLALARFLATTQVRLVILLGNHDVELAYDEVWAVVKETLLSAGGRDGQLRFINRNTEYNFLLNKVTVHVEHGNAGDPFNEILYRELFDDAEKNTGFSFPPGTRFVYDVMNAFKEHLRFVDILKPEMPAVPLLLARLEPFQSVKQLPGVSLNMLRALKNGFIGRVRQKVGGGSFGSKDEEPQANDPYAVMARWYCEQVDRESNPDHLESFLSQDETETIEQSSQPTFSPDWMKRIKNSFGNAVLKRLGRPTRFEDTSFYQTDQTGHDVELAQKQIKGDVQIAVFGHTHCALKREFSENTVYINSGAWANLIQLPELSKDFPEWLKRIAENTFERTSFPTFIKLVPAATGVQASLNHWSKQGEQVLWSKNITPLK
jgi:UDP-2,3-diacylglucosamine pyrophosphatase LpxH